MGGMAGQRAGGKGGKGGQGKQAEKCGKRWGIETVEEMVCTVLMVSNPAITSSSDISGAVTVRTGSRRFTRNTQPPNREPHQRLPS